MPPAPSLWSVVQSNSIFKTKKTGFNPVFRFNGGAKEDRTPDLLNAIQALSQLSYNPNTFKITTPFKRFLLPLVASVTRLQIFRYTSLSLVCLKATFAARHKNVHRTFLFSCAQLSYNPNVTISLQQKYS